MPVNDYVQKVVFDDGDFIVRTSKYLTVSQVFAYSLQICLPNQPWPTITFTQQEVCEFIGKLIESYQLGLDRPQPSTLPTIITERKPYKGG